jgi:DNA-binding XRE family transcriptional regulator
MFLISVAAARSRQVRPGGTTFLRCPAATSTDAGIDFLDLDRHSSVMQSIAQTDQPDRAAVFGPALRRVRTERGLTQEQLAEVSGLHRTEISLLERGERKPLLETIVGLCRGLGVTPAELLHDIKIS